MNGLNIFQPIAQGMQIGMQREQQEMQNLERQRQHEQQKQMQGLLQAGDVKGAAAINPQLAAQFQSVVGDIDKSRLQDMGVKLSFISQLPDGKMIEAVTELADPEGDFISRGFAELDTSDPDDVRANVFAATNAFQQMGLMQPLSALGPKTTDDIRNIKEYKRLVDSGQKKEAMLFAKGAGMTEPNEKLKAYNKEVGAQNAKMFGDIKSAGKAAGSNLRTLELMEQLSDDAFDGTFAGARLSISKLANQLGMDIEGVPESELFEALANNLTIGKVGQLSGALSDKDIAFLQATVPQLNQTKEGRKQLIGIMKDLAKLEQDYAREAQRFSKGRQFDPLEFEEYMVKKRQGEDRLSQYYEQEQLGPYNPSQQQQTIQVGKYQVSY